MQYNINRQKKKQRPTLGQQAEAKSWWAEGPADEPVQLDGSSKVTPPAPSSVHQCPRYGKEDPAGWPGLFKGEDKGFFRTGWCELRETDRKPLL